jgi:hypothetical protein
MKRTVVLVLMLLFAGGCASGLQADSRPQSSPTVHEQHGGEGGGGGGGGGGRGY